MTKLLRRSLARPLLLVTIAGALGGCGAKETVRQNGPQMDDHAMHSETGEVFEIELVNAEPLTVGEPLDLNFRIKGKEGVLLKKDLAETHEKLLHFVVVDAGLDDFNHLHPSVADDGTWTQRVTLRHRGSYLLFAEGQTAKGSAFVARRPVRGSREASDSPTKFEVSLRSKTGEAEAEIVNPDEVRSGADSNVRVRVTPADGWEPYLGAPGHLILIDKEGKEFVHAHPTRMEGGIADFHAVFKKAGLYRGWAQFQRDGRVLTFPFTIDVGVGEPDKSGKSTSHH